MNRKTIVLVWAAVCSVFTTFNPAFAQGTAFTYQGRLNSGGASANGSYDVAFTLFDSVSGGAQQGNTLTNSATAVSNGLFTATVDFGPGVFTGGSNWLEIAVSTNGANSFTTLSPREQVVPTPYAIAAGNLTRALPLAQLPAGVVTNGGSGVNLSGTFSGDGSGLTSLPPNVALLTGNQTFTGQNSFSRNLGIGTSTTAEKLNVNGNILLTRSAARTLLVDDQPDDSVSGVPLTVRAGSTSSSGVPYQAQIGGDLILQAGNGFNASLPSVHGGNVVINSGGNWISGVKNGGDIIFQTGGPNNTFVERSRILENGNVGIGTATPATALHVNGTVTATTFSGNLSGNSTTATSFTGSLDGDVTGTQSATVVSTVGGLSAANVAAGADAANAATSVNTASTIVKRDGSGNFSAGNITSSGVIVPSVGSNYFSDFSPPKYGIVWPANPGGGDGDNAWIQYYVRSGESTTLQIGIANDIDDELSFWQYGAERMVIYNGFVGINTMTPQYTLDVSGNARVTGAVYGGSFNQTSDRNAKEDLQSVSPADVLSKVASLPIQQWNFKNDAGTRHIGPMAQDFYAAFKVGPDDTHIATVDEGGVALAAIQGLNEKVESGKQKAETLERRLEQKETEITELKARLERLEQLLQIRNGGE